MSNRIARLLPVFQGGVGGYDWYVDGDITSSGDGKSLAGAFKTIAELSGNWAAGESVWIEPKDDESAYREALVYPGIGCSVYSSGQYDHVTGAWTGGAKLSGADIAANASFSKTGGLTNVYEIAVTVDAGSNQFVNVFEDGTFLTRRASTALVDANAGSYSVTGESGSITLYIHASDSSDVTANGKVYEYTKRSLCIFTDYASCTLYGVSGEKALGDAGCLSFKGPGSNISHFMAKQGGSHVLLFDPTGNPVITNGLVQDANDTTSGTMVVYNADVFNGDDLSVSNITIERTSANVRATSLIAGMNGHMNVSGALNSITLTDCVFKLIEIPLAGFNHCPTVTHHAPTFTNCKLGLNAAAGQTVNITGTTGSWTSTVANQRAVNMSETGTLNINTGTFTINQNAATDLGMVTVTAAGTLNLSGVQFVQNLTSGLRVGVYCSSAGATLTLTNNVYNSTGKGWSYNYLFTAGASGMTWSSDYNTFESFVVTGWGIFGTNYATLGLYQAAVTPNDANSTAS